VEPLQLLLVIIGLAVASGGIVLLINSRGRTSSARGPFMPLAMAFVGIMIAYRAYTEFSTLQPLDLVIMFLFVVALGSLLGIQFFIVDRSKHNDKE
jgi:drug/metabolite transporter (DMT)-like permease